MPFKMGMSKEDLTGPPPIPPGVYFLQVTNFKPKVSRKGDSLNYNAEFTVTQHPQYDGRKVFSSLNTGFAVGIRDFVHACGIDMELVHVPSTAEEDQHDEFTLPGMFEDSDKYPDNPEKWGRYLGPLTNKIFKAELAIVNPPGYKPKNEVRVYSCAYPGCATEYPDVKHSQNLIKA
jgi:hypothetical protein